MNRSTRISLRIVTALVPLVLLLGMPTGSRAEPSEPDAAAIAAGRVLYELQCVFCHGAHGEGDGPVAFFLSRDVAPRPRDFTTEPFKFRSTPSGELPTDADLMRTITKGRPGLMPGYSGLSQSDRGLLIAYVKSLVPAYSEDWPAPVSIEIGQPVVATSQSITAGLEVYRNLGCASCHGAEGQGDGPSAAALTTTGEMKILATDLTRPSSYGGGSEPQDVYRTFMTGLNGVPMPSYVDAVSEEDAWNLVNYVLSLSREGS